MKTSRKKGWACNIEIIGIERLVDREESGRHVATWTGGRTEKDIRALPLGQPWCCDRQEQGTVRGVRGLQGT